MCPSLLLLVPDPPGPQGRQKERGKSLPGSLEEEASLAGLLPPLHRSLLVCRLARPAGAHFQGPFLCLSLGPPLLVPPVSAAPSDTPNAHATPLTSWEACGAIFHSPVKAGLVSRPGLGSHLGTALCFSFPAGEAHTALRPRGQLSKLLDLTLRGKYQAPILSGAPHLNLYFSWSPPPLAFQRGGQGRALLHDGEDPKTHANPSAPRGGDLTCSKWQKQYGIPRLCDLGHTLLSC